jgi:hypothetical protein
MPHSANIPGNYTFSILNMFLKKKMVSRDPRGGLSIMAALKVEMDIIASFAPRNDDKSQ